MSADVLSGCIERLDSLTPCNRVVAIEAGLLNLGEQVDLPVRHLFGGGIYMRTLPIPAGTCLTGRIHRRQHIAILLSGTISVYDGEVARTITAPEVFITEPETKRLIYARTDAVFATIHRPDDPDERDIGAIESELVCDSFEELHEDCL